MSSVKIELRKDQIVKIHEFCDAFNNQEGELINVLHKTQSEFGYLPAEVQEVIADKMDIPVAKVYGVVTFYSFFTMKPKGQFPISICTGTACYVRGAENVLAEFKKQLEIEVGETTEDGKFSLSCLRCVGACGLAPVMVINKDTHGLLETEKAINIIKEYE